MNAHPIAVTVAQTQSHKQPDENDHRKIDDQVDHPHPEGAPVPAQFPTLSESHLFAGFFVLVHHADHCSLRDVAEDRGDHSNDEYKEQECHTDPDKRGHVLVGVVE
jgi:hypothetical protein